MKLTGADYELALAAARDLASDATFEEAVTQSFRQDFLDLAQRFVELATMSGDGRRCGSVTHCTAAPSCP